MNSKQIETWLRRRADDALVAMMGVMFIAFIVQIIFRYLLNFPIGWTSELTIILWVWLVLWGAAFVISDEEEIRIDLVTSMVDARVRRAMFILVAIAIVALYVVSLPAAYSYVTFMKVERSSYLKIPMNWVFSIFLFFVVAVVVRYLWLLWDLLRGKEPEAADPTKMASGI